MSNTHCSRPLKKQISPGYAYCWINSFPTASETQSCAACQQQERAKCGSEAPACERMKELKELKLSALPWASLTAAHREDDADATFLMGKCWQGFVLDSSFLCWLSWPLIPPSDRFCGSTAWCNNSQAASSRDDSLASLHQPGRLSGRKGSRHCLVAPTYPTAMPGWSYLKASSVLHSCELGFSSKSTVLWSPLVMSALLALAE